LKVQICYLSSKSKRLSPDSGTEGRSLVSNTHEDVEVSISLVEHAEWMKVAADEETGLGDLWLDWEDQ
jgi:hypothetical protein